MRCRLRDQVGCYKPNEFAGRYDLGFLPESRKMPQIARHQIVGSGRIGTFQEPIVVGIALPLEDAGKVHVVAAAQP